MLELTQRITHVDASEIHDNLVLPYELRIRGRFAKQQHQQSTSKA